MVEAPGTAPGSEWFIAAAIYCHSRQAGRLNIGAKRPRRKSPTGGFRSSRRSYRTRSSGRSRTGGLTGIAPGDRWHQA